MSIIDSYKRIFEKDALALLDLNRQPTALYEPVQYIMSLGGKRIRPAMCYLGVELFGDIGVDAHYAALALELFHNFTLLHDDIMDEAEKRRGFETVHVRFGQNAAILSGDLMSVNSFYHLCRLDRAYRYEVQNLFVETAISICEGQQRDMDFEQRDHVSMEEYEYMIEQKTGVLLAASLSIGAIVGGAPRDQVDLLYQFGKNLGLAFQILDDYLDAFGEINLLGKKLGGDILQSKKTALYVSTLDVLAGDPERRQQFISMYNSKDASASKVEKIKAFFESLDVDQKITQRVSDFENRAKSILGEMDISVSSATKLHSFSELLGVRTY